MKLILSQCPARKWILGQCPTRKSLNIIRIQVQPMPKLYIESSVQWDIPEFTNRNWNVPIIFETKIFEISKSYILSHLLCISTVPTQIITKRKNTSTNGVSDYLKTKPVIRISCGIFRYKQNLQIASHADNNCTSLDQNIKMKVVVSVITFAIFIVCVQPHGHIVDPPARNWIWTDSRFPDQPPNFNSQGVWCGDVECWQCPPAFYIPQDEYFSTCGMCGDDINRPTPRDHEHGGLYGNGHIGRTYSAGSVIL